MMPLDLNLALSGSSAADSGHTGAFSVSGTRGMITAAIVLAVAAIVGLIVWLKLR